MPDITMLQVPITYDLNDRIVSAARRAGLKKRQFVIRVLEEKMGEHRPLPGSDGTGNHDGDQ